MITNLPLTLGEIELDEFYGTNGYGFTLNSTEKCGFMKYLVPFLKKDFNLTKIPNVVRSNYIDEFMRVAMYKLEDGPEGMKLIKVLQTPDPDNNN